MEIDKAIETMKYNRYILGLPEQGHTWKANANTIACDMAIAVLERQNRIGASQTWTGRSVPMNEN